MNVVQIAGLRVPLALISYWKVYNTGHELFTTIYLSDSNILSVYATEEQLATFEKAIDEYYRRQDNIRYRAICDTELVLGSKRDC